MMRIMKTGIAVLLFTALGYGQGSIALERNATEAEIRTWMIEQTVENGLLDFFTPIKHKEYDGYQIKPGVFASNIEMALYKWGKSAKDLGLTNLETVYQTYSQARDKAISAKEKDLLKMGFNRELEE